MKPFPPKSPNKKPLFQKKTHKPSFKNTSPRTRSTKPSVPSSWDSVGGWYDQLVGEEGHYYHQKIIFPALLRLLEIQKTTSGALLDLACGQGVLAKQLPQTMGYTGIDAASSLIRAAKQTTKNQKHEFLVGDVSKTLPIKKRDYSYATVILALQNIASGSQVIANAAEHLCSNGKLLIVLNHPCFRIPRQSSWQIDEEKKIQFRRMDRYYNPMEIPIQMHPGKGAASANTLSYHNSLSTYSQWLFDAGFRIDKIEEWCSDKTSTGKNSKMENRSREEFPLFMTILATKYDRMVM